MISDRTVRATGGFTLVELIVVLGVLGILVGTAVPLAGSLIDGQRRAEVKAELAVLGEALSSYWFDNASFPPSLSGTDFLGVYVQPGLNGTAVKDGWGGDVEYVYAFNDPTGIATVHSRGEDGIDTGLPNEDFSVTVNAAVPGLRKTRQRMRVIVEALALFLEAGGTLTGTWSTDRAAMGLGAQYQADGWGTAFSLDPTTLVLRSAGPDRVAGNADDVTS